MWSATCQRPMLLVSFLVALNMGAAESGAGISEESQSADIGDLLY